jgi:hypothetical protein
VKRATIPREIARQLEVALIADLSPEEFQRIFSEARPEELESFAAPEPSVGAPIRLDNGLFGAVIYGKVTCTLRVDLPKDAPVGRFLKEVALPEDSITWRRASVLTTA